MSSSADLRRARERFHTTLSWLDSWHSFSFGAHYDPDNVGFGLLVVNNDDRVAPGGGFGEHAHRDMEIVTWVLEGRLEHRDSTGTRGVIEPGLAQRMSAGRGIRHSEMNADPDRPVHFVQMWVLPDRPGHEPSYAQADVSAALTSGRLVPVVGGHPDAAISLNQPAATLWVARPPAGATISIPDSPLTHLFVAMGSVALAELGRLDAGDAARLRHAGAMALQATEPDTEVLIWAMDDAEFPRAR